MSTAEPELPPEVKAALDETPEPWREEFMREWLQVKLGMEGFMLDKVQQQHAATMDLAKQAREGTLGKPSTATAAAGDDVGVSIGNKAIHYHMASTNTTASATDNSKPSTLGTVAKWGAIAATLAGTGIGSSLLTAYLVKPAPPAESAYENDGEIFEIK